MPYFLDAELNVRWFQDSDDPSWYADMRPITEAEAKVWLDRLNDPPRSAACTPAQGLVALFVLKRITEDNILQAIDSIPDDELRYTAKIGYQRASSWERSSPTMQTMAQLLQLSESDLDELFTHAAGVNL